jgi:hypothetical protein
MVGGGAGGGDCDEDDDGAGGAFVPGAEGAPPDVLSPGVGRLSLGAVPVVFSSPASPCRALQAAMLVTIATVTS